MSEQEMDAHTVSGGAPSRHGAATGMVVCGPRLGLRTQIAALLLFAGCAHVQALPLSGLKICCPR